MGLRSISKNRVFFVLLSATLRRTQNTANRIGKSWENNPGVHCCCRGNKSERFNEGLLHVRVECLVSVMSEQYNQVVCNVNTHGY